MYAKSSDNWGQLTPACRGLLSKYHFASSIENHPWHRMILPNAQIELGFEKLHMHLNRSFFWGGFYIIPRFSAAARKARAAAISKFFSTKAAGKRDEKAFSSGGMLIPPGVGAERHPGFVVPTQHLPGLSSLFQPIRTSSEPPITRHLRYQQIFQVTECASSLYHPSPSPRRRRGGGGGCGGGGGGRGGGKAQFIKNGLVRSTHISKNGFRS